MALRVSSEAEADVRQEDGVVERDQFRRNMRLVLEHVDAGRQDGPGPQRLGSAHRVDQRATGNVDERAARPSARSTSAFTIWRVSVPPGAASGGNGS